MPASQTNFQEKLLGELKFLVEPIVIAASDPEARDDFFKSIGWDLDELNPSSVTDLQLKLNAISTGYQAFNTLLQSSIESFDDLKNALTTTKQLFDAIQELKNTSGANLLQDFNKLGSDIVGFLLTNYLEVKAPVFFHLLVLLGIIEFRPIEPTGGHVFDSNSPYTLIRWPYSSHKLRFDKISQLLSDPNYFKTEYLLPLNGGNWPTVVDSTASANIIFPRLARLLNSIGVDTMVGINPALGITFGATGDSLAEQTMFLGLLPEGSAPLLGVILSLSSQAQGDMGVVITPITSASVTETLGNWELKTTISASISGFSITPNDFTFPTGFNAGHIGATVDVKKLPAAAGMPSILIGSSTGTRIQIGEFSVGGHFQLSDSLREYGAYVHLKEAAFVVSPGDGDGFLQKILPANGLQGEFDLKIMWSNVAGFHFEGAGSLELLIPIHKTILNALTIDSMIVSAKVDSSIKLITAISGNLKLGPFNAVFDEVGMQFDVDFPANKDGNLGALDIDPGFKPPKGLGLSIKSDTVTGAGFLSFDKAAGRYVGALELTIKKQITIKIIGILTTKLPNNQPGYSLLLVVTVEGFKPIQLGFGFTLNGVGGLIALHRRMNTDELRKGVRNNTIDNILFPTNPVENINSIISSLETVFPIEEGRYSFGPMAIIGWGTPTLITAELGLFFEMPNPQEFALIGVIRAVLPDENKALLRLQIAFAGIISFDKKLITFDASLFDSSLLGMTLSGDMAFRLKWGDQPTFVLTVGGFHPKFTVPQLYLPPNMTRLTMNLSGGDNPRLTLSTYFAVTSNTAQFGASVDFNWEISDKIDISGYLGFDALFFFSPFRFTATIQGGLDVKWKGDSKVSLSFSGTLEGPTPWFIRGNVSFKIFGVSYSKSLNKQIGGYQHTLVEDINVLPLLTAALQDKKNWQSTMSQDTQLLVTVREFPTNPGDLIIHPQGSIAVSQKVVPLDVTFSRFGNRRATVYNRFSIAINYLQNNATGLAKTDLKEYFAPNEFYSLSEDQRLARESFELMTSGAKVTNTSNALTSGAYHQIKQEYETIYMDSRYKPVRYNIKSLIDDTTYYSMRAGGSAASSPLGNAQSGRSSAGTPAVTVSGNSFAIAQTHNLAHYNNLTAGSETEALVLLESILETNPELEGKLNVIHAFELA